MSRDQRCADNWALLYALQRAADTGAPVAVAFNLVPEFLGAGARQFCFMLKVSKSHLPLVGIESDIRNHLMAWPSRDIQRRLFVVWMRVARLRVARRLSRAMASKHDPRPPAC